MCVDISEMRDELGELVCTEDAVRRACSGDRWYRTAMPDAVVMPRGTEDVVRVMRYAIKHGVPVTVRGGGVGYVGSCVPVRGGVVLSMERMRRILEITPEDGVAVVEPGVRTAELQEACAAQGWFYPPDPASRKDSSIGGNIATNAGGPRCLKYGVTRAYVLGLTVVLADGEVLRCGGRTHKNRQGFDLVGMFCGSEGMLGIITQAVMRIIPAPEAKAGVQAVFPQFSMAAEAVQAVLQAGCLPCALEVADTYTLQAARKYMGNAVVPVGAKGHLLVEVDGSVSAVQADAARVMQVLRKVGATDVQVAESEQEVEKLWAVRRGFSDALRATGLIKWNEDVVVPRSRLVEFVEFCEKLQRRWDVPIACFGHAGDGNVHTNIMLPPGDAGGPDFSGAKPLLDELFAWVLEHDGAVSGEHGIGLAKAQWFARAVGQVGVRVHDAVKKAMDPKGILNPGKWLAK